MGLFVAFHILSRTTEHIAIDDPIRDCERSIPKPQGGVNDAGTIWAIEPEGCPRLGRGLPGAPTGPHTALHGGPLATNSATTLAFCGTRRPPPSTETPLTLRLAAAPARVDEPKNQLLQLPRRVPDPAGGCSSLARPAPPRPGLVRCPSVSRLASIRLRAPRGSLTARGDNCLSSGAQVGPAVSYPPLSSCAPPTAGTQTLRQWRLSPSAPRASPCPCPPRRTSTRCRRSRRGSAGR
jgi:hypothetical protein